MNFEKGKGISRREFLSGSGAAALSASLEPSAAQASELPEKLQDFLDAPAVTHEYHMGALAGHRVGDPLDEMIGVKGKIPENAKIDFRHQMALLWKRKLDRKSKKTEKDGTMDVRYSEATLLEIEKLLTSYDPIKTEKLTVSEYRDGIGKAIAELRKEIDLDKITHVREFEAFGKAQVSLLKALSKQISSTTLLAYALTEIMPTRGADSETGVKALDFILRNGGPEFVERLPALYDSMLSFGPYQFTSNALFEVGRVRQGASIINSIATHRQIPGSVVKLRGSQHHKAAYCFAVYNLARAIHECGEKKAEELLKPELIKSLDASLVAEYIASAHHLPGNARRSFRSFTDQLIRSHEHPDEHVRFDPYIGHAAAAGVSGYVNKTRGNVTALGKLYGWKL